MLRGRPGRLGALQLPVGVKTVLFLRPRVNPPFVHGVAFFDRRSAMATHDGNARHRPTVGPCGAVDSVMSRRGRPTASLSIGASVRPRARGSVDRESAVFLRVIARASSTGRRGGRIAQWRERASRQRSSTPHSRAQRSTYSSSKASLVERIELMSSWSRGRQAMSL